jgi:hypothetical protein
MAEKRASTKRRRASEWQVLLSKLAESGEEVTQFCRRQWPCPGLADTSKSPIMGGEVCDGRDEA